MQLPKRARDISPFIVMEILEKAQEMESKGIDVVHLEVGEPDFDVPDPVKKASDLAMSSGYTHYSHSLGDPQLRKAIAQQYHKNHGVEVDYNQVVITSGSSPAILLALSVLMERGQEVIVPDPGYACYPNFIKILEGIPVPVACPEDNGFQYDIQNLQKQVSKNTAAIFLNSPSNPTGHIANPDQMKALIDLGKCIISDEIYHGLSYGKKAHSILEYTDNTFVINGFSKLYAMTGLRIGYLIAPKSHIRTIQKIQQNLFICASSVAQRAAIAALQECDEEVSKMQHVYSQRRRLMLDRLLDMGFEISLEPQGAFYIFVDAKKYAADSYQLAFDILEKAHVGVTPGIDFGANGEGYLRFSYANSMENIQKAMDRLGHYFSARK